MKYKVRDINKLMSLKGETVNLRTKSVSLKKKSFSRKEKHKIIYS